MASTKIRPSKMARLPEDVQEFLNSLSDSGFKGLRNAILPSAYFDFLGLPLELREAIYELVFATASGTITSVDHKKKQSIVSTAILAVSRTVHTEAGTVLYRTNTCKLVVNPEAAKLGYRLGTNDMLPFARFRKVELSILGLNCNIGLDGRKVDSLGSMLPHMVEMLALVHELTGYVQKKTITFDFQHGSDHDIVSVARPAQGVPWRHYASWIHVVFYRAQAAHLIARMRKELLVRAPGVVIISNVEGTVPGLETAYKKHQSIMCRVHSVRAKAHLFFSSGTLQMESLPWETNDPL